MKDGVKGGLTRNDSLRSVSGKSSGGTEAGSAAQKAYKLRTGLRNPALNGLINKLKNFLDPGRKARKLAALNREENHSYGHHSEMDSRRSEKEGLPKSSHQVSSSKPYRRESAEEISESLVESTSESLVESTTEEEGLTITKAATDDERETNFETPRAFTEDSTQFINPLYNPHLDDAGDNRFYDRVVKKAKGAHLLDALSHRYGRVQDAIPADRIHYRFGGSKGRSLDMNALIPSIGAEAASFFGRVASTHFASKVLEDLHSEKAIPERLATDVVESIEWNLQRDAQGAVTAHYRIQIGGPSRPLVSGTIYLDADAQPVLASKIIVEHELQQAAKTGYESLSRVSKSSGQQAEEEISESLVESTTEEDPPIKASQPQLVTVGKIEYVGQPVDAEGPIAFDLPDLPEEDDSQMASVSEPLVRSYDEEFDDAEEEGADDLPSPSPQPTVTTSLDDAALSALTKAKAKQIREGKKDGRQLRRDAQATVDRRRGQSSLSAAGRESASTGRTGGGKGRLLDQSAV